MTASDDRPDPEKIDGGTKVVAMLSVVACIFSVLLFYKLTH